MMNKLAAYYRLIELADRMRQDGLACPKCRAVSVAHQLLDNSNDPHLVCASCGASFTADDLVVVPAFEMENGLVILYRPVGPEELAKIEATGWTRFPPRLHWHRGLDPFAKPSSRANQPIFYPVLNERYAEYIAEEWNVDESRAGYMMRFRVKADTARKYPAQEVGATWYQELWVAAEELDAFNDAIVGTIEVVGKYGN